MEVTKVTEPKQDSQREYANLDKRYGKIGISAVVAALRHPDKPRGDNKTWTGHYEHD